MKLVERNLKRKQKLITTKTTGQKLIITVTDTHHRMTTCMQQVSCLNVFRKNTDMAWKHEIEHF